MHRCSRCLKLKRISSSDPSRHVWNTHIRTFTAVPGEILNLHPSLGKSHIWQPIRRFLMETTARGIPLPTWVSPPHANSRGCIIENPRADTQTQVGEWDERRRTVECCIGADRAVFIFTSAPAYGTRTHANACIVRWINAGVQMHNSFSSSLTPVFPHPSISFVSVSMCLCLTLSVSPSPPLPPSPALLPLTDLI